MLANAAVTLSLGKEEGSTRVRVRSPPPSLPSWGIGQWGRALANAALVFPSFSPALAT